MNLRLEIMLVCGNSIIKLYLENSQDNNLKDQL
jgi:hypothetical protein